MILIVDNRKNKSLNDFNCRQSEEKSLNDFNCRQSEEKVIK